MTFVELDAYTIGFMITIACFCKLYNDYCDSHKWDNCHKIFNSGCSYINVFLQARSSENIAGSAAHLTTIVDDLLKTYKSINRGRSGSSPLPPVEVAVETDADR